MVAQHGQEDQVGLAVGHRRHQPVVELHRRAERDVGPLDAALEHLLIGAEVDLDLEAELVEEGAEERDQALQHELVGDRDPARARRRRSRGRRARRSARARGTDRARGRAACFLRVPLSQSEQPPPQVKRCFLPSTRVRERGRCGTCCPRRRSPWSRRRRRCLGARPARRGSARDPYRRGRLGQLAQRQQRDAERAHGARVGRDDDLAAGLASHRPRPARPTRTACPGRRPPGRPSGCPSPG